MRIEQITLSNGEVILILPPSLYDLPIFEHLFHIVCLYVQEWSEAYKDLSVKIELTNGLKNQFERFIAIAFKRVPIELNIITTLSDWVQIQEGFKCVMILEELPPFKISSLKKADEFEPTINKTSDAYNDYIGDILAGLESTGVQLCKEYDLNSIRQILYRIEQHRYWSNPQNIEKAQQIKDIEVYGDMLYEMSYSDQEWE